MTDAFRGFGALLLERGRIVLRTGLWGGLVGGLALGTLLRILEEQESLFEFLVAVTIAAAIVVPFATGAQMIISGLQAGVRPRRDELLALPIGKLAIPAAALAASAGALALVLSLQLLGVASVLGEAAVVKALAEHADAAGTLAGVAALAFIWSRACVSMGTGPIGLAGLWPALGMLVVASVEGMGYGRDELKLYAWVLGGAGALLYLLLPFVLYAGPAHRWALVRDDKGWPDGIALFGGMLGLAWLCLAGAGWGLAAILGATAVLVALALRRQPRVERRSTPLLRIANICALVAIAPPFALGLAVDAARMAASERPGPGTGTIFDYRLSPDGRHLVAINRPVGFGVTRAIVADLDGAGPPRLLGPRFASLDPCAWSSDGRYLAVPDEGVGRIVMPYHGGLQNTRSRREAVGTGLLRSLLATLIVDTETGALARLPPRITAPGWRKPEELVHLGVRLDGSYVLSDGRGRSAAVPWIPLGPQIKAYEDGTAIVVLEGERFFRLEPEGLVEDPARPEPGPWRYEVVARHSDPKHPRYDVTFRRAGGETCTVADCVRVPVWTGASAALVVDRDGLTFVDLPGGRRETVIPSDRKPRADRGHWAADPRRVIVDTEDGTFLLDVASRTLAPVAERGGARLRDLPSRWFAGDRIVGGLPDGGLVTSARPGEPFRPVFGE